MLKNYEVIQKLPIDKLAKFLNHTDCNICSYRFTKKCFSLNGMGTKTCSKGIEEWLNKEYEEGSFD